MGLSGSSSLPPRTARFGLFEVNLETGEVKKAGVRVRLQHQPFLVLSILLERPGRLVTRDELRERLWPDDTFVDFEHGVTTAVKKLRQALNDSASKPRFVETLPKRGYRFVAEVEFDEAGPEASPTASDRPLDAPPPAASDEPVAPASSQAISDEPPTPVPPVRIESGGGALSRRALWLTALGAGVVALGLFLTLSPDRGSLPSDSVRRFSFAPESLRRADPGPAISPDGKFIAYVGDAPEFSLWVRAVASEEAYAIEGSREARLPFWSPDSRFIGYVSEGRLMRASPQGGSPVTICDMPAGNYNGGAWTQSGEIYFSAGFPPLIYRVPATGGDPEHAFSPATLIEPGGRYDPAVPAYPTDRNLMAFAVGSLFARRIVVRDLDTGEERVLDTGRRPAFSASGQLLYDWGGNVWAVPFAAADLAASGEAVLVARQGQRASASNAGTLVYADDLEASRKERFVWRGAEGSRLKELEAAFDSIWYFSPAPDGRRIAVVDRQDDTWRLWVVDVESGRRRRLAVEARLGYPVWSPDGERLAYRVGQGEGAVVRIVGADSVQEDEPLERFAVPSASGPTDWRGRDALVFSRADDLWVARPSREGERDLSLLFEVPGEQISAKFSPEGRRVAYCSDETGQLEVFVADLEDPGRRVQISLAGGMQPWWRSNREIVYLSSGRLMKAELDPSGEPASTQILFSDRRLFPQSPRRYVYAPVGEGFVTIESLGENLRRSIRIVDGWAEEHWPSGG